MDEFGRVGPTIVAAGSNRSAPIGAARLHVDLDGHVQVTADAFVFVDDVPRVTTGTLGGRVGGEAYADGRSLADE